MEDPQEFSTEDFVARCVEAIDLAATDLQRDRVERADDRFGELVADARHLATLAGSLSDRDLRTVKELSDQLDLLVASVAWLHAGAVQAVQAMLHTTLGGERSPWPLAVATAASSEAIGKVVEQLIGDLALLAEDNIVLGLTVDALAATNLQLGADLRDRDGEIESLRRQVDALRVLLEENSPRQRRPSRVLLNVALTISTLLGGVVSSHQLVEEVVSSAVEIERVCEESFDS